jgi:hypothetical protein
VGVGIRQRRARRGCDAQVLELLAAMTHQGWDVQLTAYAARDWRANFRLLTAPAGNFPLEARNKSRITSNRSRVPKL